MNNGCSRVKSSNHSRKTSYNSPKKEEVKEEMLHLFHTPLDEQHSSDESTSEISNNLKNESKPIYGGYRRTRKQNEGYTGSRNITLQKSTNSYDDSPSYITHNQLQKVAQMDIKKNNPSDNESKGDISQTAIKAYERSRKGKSKPRKRKVSGISTTSDKLSHPKNSNKVKEMNNSNNKYAYETPIRGSLGEPNSQESNLSTRDTKGKLSKTDLHLRNQELNSKLNEIVKTVGKDKKGLNHKVENSHTKYKPQVLKFEEQRENAKSSREKNRIVHLISKYNLAWF